MTLFLLWLKSMLQNLLISPNSIYMEELLKLALIQIPSETLEKVQKPRLHPSPLNLSLGWDLASQPSRQQSRC